MVHQPERKGLRSADAARREDQLLGAITPDQARQALGPTSTGNDAQTDLGQPEHRVVGGDNEVGQHRQLGATAEGEAVDGGDHRLRHVAQLPEHAPEQLALSNPLFRREVASGLQVSPSAERALARATQNDRPDGIVRRQALARLPELLTQGVVDSVEHLGSIQDHLREMTFALDQNRRAHS